MKKVKFNRKLVLNKETISNMNTLEMNNVKGGTDDFPRTAIMCTNVWCKISELANCPTTTT